MSSLTHVPLYQVVIKGDQGATRSILVRNDYAIQLLVAKSDDIALHIVISARQTSFARKLLREMKLEDLKIRNNEGCSTLHVSAMFGVVEIVRKMVRMDRDLLLMHDNSKLIPLQIAVFCVNREVTLFLFGETNFEDLKHDRRIDLFLATIFGDLYGCNRICDKALLRTLANKLVHLLWENVRMLPEIGFFQLLEGHSS